MMTNPYPGVRPFEYAETHLFFGREGQAEKIAVRLEQNHFVAVVGSSGSGKSSLVRAGLLPLLYCGRMFGSTSNWRMSLMRPGDRPIHNLAAALVYPEKFGTGESGSAPAEDRDQIGFVETLLRRSGVGIVDYVKTAGFEEGENLLIVVDQFEELFRFKEKMRVGHVDEATAFVKLLLEATADKDSRIFIAITMRSDFLGDCAEFRGLPEAINDGQYLVSRMTRDNLRASIESPAKVFDAEVAPALVNHLLNKLDGDSDGPLEQRERLLQDQLPVMQHAIMRTWDEWESRNTPGQQITREHYEAIGGMQRALSVHANEAFDELDEKQILIAQKMFKCLTEKDEDSRETRRPATVREICAVAGASMEEVFAVIDVFRREGRTFLMPPPMVPLAEGTKIDISHESLIRNWDKLIKWVEEESKDAWHYRRLSEAANTWIYEKNRNEDFLWRGRVIEEADGWYSDFKPNQSWAARYQVLNEREKAALAEIGRVSPEEENERRQKLFEERFVEAKSFVGESRKFEIREREREDEIRQEAIRGFYVKWLKRLAVVAGGIILFLFVISIASIYRNLYQTDERAINRKALFNQELQGLRAADNLEKSDAASESGINQKNTFYTNLTAGEYNSNNAAPANSAKDSNIVPPLPPCIQNADGAGLDCPGYKDFKVQVIKEMVDENAHCMINVSGPSLADRTVSFSFRELISDSRNKNPELKGEAAPSFSSRCGTILQWRVADDGQIALIVPVNIFEKTRDFEDFSPTDQYLMIARITTVDCVTGLMPILSTSIKDGYSAARKLADEVNRKPCFGFTEVMFEPGTSSGANSATVSPAIPVTFSLRAFAGQKMNVRLSPTRGDAGFYIQAPDGNIIIGPVKNYGHELTKSGVYNISVKGDADFNIKFDVAGKVDQTKSAGTGGSEIPPISQSYEVVDVNSNLNVRATPGIHGGIAGKLPSDATGIKVTGGVQVADDLYWIPITYVDENNRVINGWVAQKYLQESQSQPNPTPRDRVIDLSLENNKPEQDQDSNRPESRRRQNRP